MEAKLQLVRCPVDDPSVTADQWNMPLDLLLLASGAGDMCEVEIIDGTLFGIDDVRHRLTSKAVCVAFTYTALSSRTLGLLTAESKQNGSFVIVGGQPAAGAALSLVHEKSIDAVCIGDGIPVIAALAKQIASGCLDAAKLPNVLTRINDSKVITTERVDEDVWSQRISSRKIGGIDPEVYFRHYPETNTLINMGGTKAANVYSKRGCPYTCSFCARQDKKVRLRNPSLVAAEIRDLVADYGVNYILDMSDTWVDIKWAEEYREERLHHGIRNVPMMVFADSRHITPDACKLMRQCGVDSVLLGIESGSERILRTNNKMTTRNAIIAAVDSLVQAGIQVSCSFVFGLLEEDDYSIVETLNLCETLIKRPGVLCYGNVIMPLMGSQLWATTFTPDKTWPTFITKAFEYDLALVRELYVREATRVSDVVVLENACKTLLELSNLELLEYAR